MSPGIGMRGYDRTAFQRLVRRADVHYQGVPQHHADPWFPLDLEGADLEGLGDVQSRGRSGPRVARSARQEPIEWWRYRPAAVSAPKPAVESHDPALVRHGGMTEATAMVQTRPMIF